LRALFGSLLCADFTDTDALHNRCECIIQADLEGFENKDTFIYYAFENYYQNHRRYVKSRSDAQLRSAQLMGNDECDPLEKKDGKYYAPCGLIANSLFNGRQTPMGEPVPLFTGRRESTDEVAGALVLPLT